MSWGDSRCQQGQQRSGGDSGCHHDQWSSGDDNGWCGVLVVAAAVVVADGVLGETLPVARVDSAIVSHKHGGDPVLRMTTPGFMALVCFCKAAALICGWRCCCQLGAVCLVFNPSWG